MKAGLTTFSSASSCLEWESSRRWLYQTCLFCRHRWWHRCETLGTRCRADPTKRFIIQRCRLAMSWQHTTCGSWFEIFSCDHVSPLIRSSTLNKLWGRTGRNHKLCSSSWRASSTVQNGMSIYWNNRRMIAFSFESIHWSLSFDSNNMLYPREDKTNRKLLFACRNCHFEEDADNNCVYRHEIVHAPSYVS